MYLFYLVALDFITFDVLNFVTLMKEKGLARHLQLSSTVYLHSHTFFNSKQINLQKKNKGGQKIYDFMM